MMNDVLPMARRLQTFDNTHDGWCFVCGLLWEDTNHVLRCCGDECTLARNKALHTFWLHLQWQHTPDILAQLLYDCIQRWILRHPITQPVWTPPLEPIHHFMSHAYAAQSKIGWDQFLCGRIATQWNDVIHCKIRTDDPEPSLHPTNGCALLLMLFGPLPSCYGANAMKNYMDTVDNYPAKPSDRSIWSGLPQYIMTPLMMITLTSFTARPWPIWLSGPNNTLMLTLLWLKWLVNGILSLVSFFLSCAASLYVVRGGSHMVHVIGLGLNDDFKVSFTNQDSILPALHCDMQCGVGVIQYSRSV
jgi:hypothetical protein